MQEHKGGGASHTGADVSRQRIGGTDQLPGTAEDARVFHGCVTGGAIWAGGAGVGAAPEPLAASAFKVPQRESMSAIASSRAVIALAASSE